MSKKRKIEPSPCSEESLLSFASDEEREQIEALLKELNGSESTQANDERVCTTLAEAAVALGVTMATLDKWLADPTFPGKRGTRGRAAASFPVGEIRRWREQRYGTARTGGDVASESRRRKQAAEAALKELEFERRAGSLIERDKAEAIYAETVSTARSLLEEVPHAIASLIPATRPKLRRKVESGARRRILQVLDSLAGGLAKREAEDEAEGDDE